MVLRWWLYTFITLLELFVSTIVHVCYGLWIALSAVVQDLAGFISEEHRRSSSKVMPILSSAFSPMNGTLVDLAGVDPERHMGHTAATAFMDADVKTPIVMLHGIFGFGKGKLGKLSYWGGAELKDDRVLVPDLGSLTSIHDRACALFYYLKGGTVQYGATHESGHAASGRTYDEGHYPEWDEHHPVHFVGHSTGVQVARLLQQLLAEKKFPGHKDTNEHWVISITSLSGALNGTTRVHMDGISEDGRTLRSVCLLQVLRIAVLIYEWIDFGILNKYYGFGFEHYNLSWRKAGLKGLISTLSDRSGPFVNSDWILPDLSIHSAIEFNKRVKTYPNTYYFSYASKITRKTFGFTLPSSLFRIHPLLLLRSIQMCIFRFTTPPYEGYRDEDWQDNDGALNTKSQLFPCIPTPHPNQEMEGDELKVGQTFQPGIWYYRVIEGDHINFIINKDRAGVQFDILYDNIFQRCRKHYQRPTESQLSKKAVEHCKIVISFPFFIRETRSKPAHLIVYPLKSNQVSLRLTGKVAQLCKGCNVSSGRSSGSQSMTNPRIELSSDDYPVPTCSSRQVSLDCISSCTEQEQSSLIVGRLPGGVLAWRTSSFILLLIHSFIVLVKAKERIRPSLRGPIKAYSLLYSICSEVMSATKSVVLIIICTLSVTISSIVTEFIV